MENETKQNGVHSTFDQSDDVNSRLNYESDEDDAVYVPFEYQGDGRKREAKRHKMSNMVAKDEIEIDRMISNF